MRRLVSWVISFVLIFCVFAVQALASQQYTNLVDTETIKEVSARLSNAGIHQNRIETALLWIQEYNERMKDAATLQAGYADAEISDVALPDFTGLYRAWWDDTEHWDILCRIFVFELMQDAIAVDHPIAPAQWDVAPMRFEKDENGSEIPIDDGGWLQSDMDIMRDAHYVDWNDDQKSIYYSLFNTVFNADGDVRQLGAMVENTFLDRGVQFTSDKVSMISVWTYEKNKKAMGCAHAGILIEDENGLLFIEKTDPLYPYRATKYHSTDDLAQDLTMIIQKTRAQYDLDAVPTIVMRNNHILSAE